MDVWKRSYAVEEQQIVQIHCWVTTTKKISRIGGEKFLHCGTEDKVLRGGSVNDCADPLLGINTIMNPRTKQEKFLHREIVERVLCH